MAASFYHLVRLVVGPDTARRGQAVCHSWARESLRILGVEVTVEGAVPGIACLLAANHRSYVDIPAIAASVPVAFLAKEEVASWPLFGPGARRIGCVFVRRSCAESRNRAVHDLRTRLTDRVSMVVFPEGTTTAGPGVGRFRPGAFRLAASGGFPVVPVAIRYAHTEDAWTGNDTFVRHFLDRFAHPRMSVQLAFGPILAGSDPAAISAAAERWIACRLQAWGEGLEQPKEDGHEQEALHGGVPASARAVPAG
jgi:1-acyl-sn-glycerol-3-phosphate acyltransferase